MQKLAPRSAKLSSVCLYPQKEIGSRRANKDVPLFLLGVWCSLETDERKGSYDSVFVFLLLLLLTHGLVSFKLLYGLCRYALSAFVPPSVIPNLQKNIWRGQAIKQICE
jgi:hypothetical protein